MTLQTPGEGPGFHDTARDGRDRCGLPLVEAETHR